MSSHNYKHIYSMYILIGIPASGKSTLSNILANKIHAIILSTDEIREEYFGVKFSPSIKSFVFDELINRAKFFCNQGKNLIIDTTYLNDKTSRLKFLSELQNNSNQNYLITAVIFDVKMELCIERDRTRQKNRRIGFRIIQELSSILHFPDSNEPFDLIIRSEDLIMQLVD